MTPGAHLLASWFVATRAELPVRERRLVTLAGVLPNLDGLGVVADVLSHGRTAWYETYHHQVGHTLLAGLLLALGCGLLARTRKGAVALLAFATFHLHLLCDLVGSRGPDGYRWPIPYLAPFTRAWQATWQGQWFLNGWQNLSILGLLLGWSFAYAARRRHSFIEVISARLDRAIFQAVAARWPA
jgi:hypothetical protein